MTPWTPSFYDVQNRYIRYWTTPGDASLDVISARLSLWHDLARVISYLERIDVVTSAYNRTTKHYGKKLLHLRGSVRQHFPELYCEIPNARITDAHNLNNLCHWVQKESATLLANAYFQDIFVPLFPHSERKLLYEIRDATVYKQFQTVHPQTVLTSHELVYIQQNTHTVLRAYYSHVKTPAAFVFRLKDVTPISTLVEYSKILGMACPELLAHVQQRVSMHEYMAILDAIAQNH